MTIRDLAGFFVAAAVCLQTFAEPAHPVLFASKSDFETLRQRCAADPDAKLAKERILFDAESLLKAKPCTRVMEGFRLLGVSRQVLCRTTTLAMAYRLTGNEAYARRCADEMNAAAAFTDWNPGHFLDVAELTLALAVGYDWIYDTLTPDERKAVSDAIIEKGIKAGQKQPSWVNAKNNWGQVCHAGMIAGALAIRDLDKPLADATLKLAIEKLPLSMAALAPNGCYPEGPGYWAYGISFNVLAVAMLEHAEKNDFGLIAQPGFKETFWYPDRVTGPSGYTFNYADGGDGRGSEIALWWFAKRFNHPEVLTYRERAEFRKYCAQRPSSNKSGNRLLAIAMLWLVPETAPAAVPQPGNWSSGGIVPIVIQRTSWDNDTAVFVGLKAGSADAPHGHMDAGSFVYDAHGLRWAWDLGAEGYNKIEQRGMKLWGWSQHSDRWKIFRLNNYSHNTLVIDGQLHSVKGSAKVIEFVDQGVASRAVLDMTTVYPMCSRAIRTGTMDKNGIYTLSDSLEGLKPGTKVRWQMMTKAAGDTSVKGTLILAQKDKKLVLAAADPQTQWCVEDAEKPKNEWDTPNKGCRFVYFEAIAPASGKLEFAVTFTP